MRDRTVRNVKNLDIAVTETFYNFFKSSNYVSTRKGKTSHMFKETAVRRRKKAQIDAEKELKKTVGDELA